MPSAHLQLKEEDVIKLVLDFLTNRELNITQLSLERETGVINGVFSDDMLFLRQLILDGQWEDVLEFIQPLEGLDGFETQQFRFIVLKHSYIELLCIKSEVGPVTAVDTTVDEVVKCLNDLEKCCPSREEYSSLCLLLTLPRLTDHVEYRNWNPSSARVDCFRTIFPLVEKYLPANRKNPPVNDKSKRSLNATAKNDRLMQLIIKGILYEYCVEYCQHKATSSNDAEVQFGSVLDGIGFTDADLSLPSWLQSIPSDVFACPFEQRSLAVDVEKMDKPSLEASWTEHILVTPIKPKTFPHSAMPNMRPRSAADIMSRSLNPHLDGLAFGLSSQRHLMAMSVGDVNSMSKSFASFHLTGKKSMNTSVDKLFEGGDVFSSSYSDIPGLSTHLNSPPVPPPRRPRSKSPERKIIKPESGSTTANFLLKSTQGNLNAKCKGSISEEVTNDISLESFSPKKEVSCSPELYKEFQKQKLRLQESMMMSTDNRFREAMEEQNSAKEISCHNIYNSPSTLIDPETRRIVTTSTPIKNTPTSFGSKPNTPLSFPILNTSKAEPNQVVMDNESARSSFGYTNTSGSGVRPTVTTALSNINKSGETFINTNSSHNCSHNSLASDMSTPSLNSLSSNSFQKMDSQLKAKHGLVTQPAKTLTSTSSNSNGNMDDSLSQNRPHFIPVTSLDDVQAIRAAEFHPSGKLYAIGSNSKTLRICAYPKMTDLSDNHQSYQPTVLFKRNKHHKGSIYCCSWNATGDLLATGSNDKSVKLMRFNAETCNIEGDDVDLTMHDGTVRDLCFMEDMSNKSSLLISGGAGDCKIYVTDCMTGTPFQALSGHTGHILSLFTWGGAMFTSGSQDRTIRFWDLRTRGCVNVIPSPPSGTGAVKGGPVTTVAVDPSGRMLVSGQEDASCMLYDIRGNRIIQVFKPHTSDIRTVRFSPRAYYLLTGSYDNKIVLSDLQGDLTMPLPSVVVAEHKDKVIQCRWHPTEFSFLSTSADKTATLWGLPTS